ncbi:hypothetical protein GJ688_00990 [Heliobacillus mobilis]|uniref:Cell division protein FtsL n=1 Tax=Heliobacterium mobile TaxID=28064 RepID=A0A6I3SBR1_HELMO|nr:cell division protein FtsL [Heliobacterium mobile]MTV47553.1 hypothetical protein [Heliobacterium mobile]
MKQATAPVYDYQEEVLQPSVRPSVQPKKERRVKQGISGKTKRKVIASTIAIMGCGLIIGSQYAVVAYQAQHVMELRQELTKEKNSLDYLRVEVNQLKSLERVENIAVNKLGMKTPEGTKMIAIQSQSRSDKPAQTAQEQKPPESEKKGNDAPVQETDVAVGTNPLVATITKAFHKLSGGLL